MIGKEQTAAADLGMHIQDPQRFANNMLRLTEEAGKAVSAFVEPRIGRPFESSSAADAFRITKTFAEIQQAWLAQPARLMAAQATLWQSYLDLLSSSLRGPLEEGETSVSSDTKDTRFKDPDWSKNQFFDLLKQSYFITSKWAESLVDEVEGADPETQRKARFYMKQIVNAIAPSNWVFTNPELLRETFASDGENLVRGMQLLAEDIRRGSGNLKIRQTDVSKFEVGKNLAITRGKVIFQNDLLQLIQYEPTTERVLKRPLLIVPPWINKFYILDLNPEKSFIKWAVAQGHTVFVVSWVNPNETLAHKSFEDYMREGVLGALDPVTRATGEKGVNAIGYCVGGTLLGATLAYMAQVGDKRVKSATFFTTQVDFKHAGDLKVFADEEQIQGIEREMSRRGYLDSSKMATIFNLLRSNDLIWPYIVNVYVKGKEPLPFDLLYWNSDSTRMPAANHSFYLRHCYLQNDLSAGRMEFGGVRLDLSKVTLPIYHLAAREDHIAPPRSVFAGAQCFGGEVNFVLAGSGHIAGVINPPAKGKYQYWTGDRPTGELESWLGKAKEHSGSWWPNWQNWVEDQDKKRVAARRVGSGKLKAIENAPGSYVRAS